MYPGDQQPTHAVIIGYVLYQPTVLYVFNMLPISYGFSNGSIAYTCFIIVATMINMYEAI